MISYRFILHVLLAVGMTMGVASASLPVYPCLLQAEDYSADGEGVGYHDTTRGNAGGAYRHDDVDIWSEGGRCYIGNTTPGEWLDYNFSIGTVGETRPVPVLLRVAADRSGTRIALSLDGALRSW